MTTDPTEAALLAAVLAEPAEDLHRLAYADWLDEHAPSKASYAAFIRAAISAARPFQPGEIHCPCLPWGRMPSGGLCECDRCGASRREKDLWSRAINDTADMPDGYWVTAPHWNEPVDTEPWCGVAIVRRGFVDEVRCDTRTLLGGACVVCNGSRRTGGPVSDDCPGCVGRSEFARTEGVAAAVFARHPVTAVELVDRVPAGTVDPSPGWMFWCRQYQDFPLQTHHLPTEVFDRLEGGVLRQIRGVASCDYDTEAAARAALSAAVVRVCRARAGLA